MRQRQLVGLVVAGALAASLAADVLFKTGPIHALGCLLGARDGWFVEYPRDAVTADEVREVIPSCVPVHVGYIDWDEVAEGDLAIKPFGRDWFGRDDSLTLWVEGTAAQAADPCRPPPPLTAPTGDCADGLLQIP